MSRTLLHLAAVAMVATIGASCSNGSRQADTSTTATPASLDENTDSTREQGLKFAECMRDNGIEDFPDPDASGVLTIDAIANGSSVDTNSAQFDQAITERGMSILRAAMQKCGDFAARAGVRGP